MIFGADGFFELGEEDVGVAGGQRRQGEKESHCEDERIALDLQLFHLLTNVNLSTSAAGIRCSIILNSGFN